MAKNNTIALMTTSSSGPESRRDYKAGGRRGGEGHYGVLYLSVLDKGEGNVTLLY